MKSRLLASTAACLALSLAPRASWGAELDCDGTSVAPDARLTARFPDLAERIRTELAERSDLDRCARIELELEAETVITIAVLLPDGRATSRSVTRSEDVIPTLQALLLVPERATPSRPPRGREAPRVVPSGGALLASPLASQHDTLPPKRAARTMGFELSVLTGARTGDGQLAAGGGMLSFLELKHWLVGFQGRIDSYRPLLGGDTQTVVELGLLGGRRLDLGSVALDLTAGPALAMQGVTLAQTEEVAQVESGTTVRLPPPQRAAETGSGPLPRLWFGARLGFRPRSVLRTFVGLEGEVGPAGATDERASSLGRLPAFCFGLALGATVGTR